MRRRLILVLLILVLLLIWGQSCLPVKASSKESGTVFNLIRPFLEFFLGEGQVTHTLVRKLAHFAEFFVLGCLASSFFPMQRKKRMLCFGFCLFAALLDETIQIFSGRGDLIQDIWLDFAGAAAGILIVTLFRWLLTKQRSKKADVGRG